MVEGQRFSYDGLLVRAGERLPGRHEGYLARRRHTLVPTVAVRGGKARWELVVARRFRSPTAAAP